MTIGAISIIVGVVLLFLLKLFFEDEDWASQRGDHNGLDEDCLSVIDASDDPGLTHLPGNSYHYSWSASHSDRE